VTSEDKLAAILAAVQTDPGNRGLARDPVDNLFTASAGDFQRACRSLTTREGVARDLLTGFHIPTGEPPGYETDGPLSCAFLLRALANVGIQCAVVDSPEPCRIAIEAGLKAAHHGEYSVAPAADSAWPNRWILQAGMKWPGRESTHTMAVEFAGPAGNGRSYSMRGRDITGEATAEAEWHANSAGTTTIGIGDGGNEIGMGKIPHETIVKNIPNGDLIHCRVPTDHLIVAGVSNWGAYALAAGLFVLLDRKPPADLFDPDRELAILEAMVREGPLVDGVTGKQTATVDGLSWEEYSRPLLEMRRILDA
jgi:hypothetical protein